jgi:hypothetical protein
MYIMMDQSRLKREFTEENLTAWAEYRAECHRANYYFKRDGWSEGTLFDWDPDKKQCTLQLRWGDDQNHQENYCHYEDLDEQEYLRQYDEYVLSVKLTDFIS